MVGLLGLLMPIVFIMCPDAVGVPVFLAVRCPQPSFDDRRVTVVTAGLNGDLLIDRVSWPREAIAHRLATILQYRALKSVYVKIDPGLTWQEAVDVLVLVNTQADRVILITPAVDQKPGERWYPCIQPPPSAYGLPGH